MIVMAGGTGTLGTQVVRLLTARGLEVRILTRNPARAEHERGDPVEIVSGDVQDARGVERAMAGGSDRHLGDPRIWRGRPSQPSGRRPAGQH
jgi:uncharacterized protein YbjT (DUF2867 family)